MEKLNELREKRRLAYKQFKASMNLYVRAQQLTGALKQRYAHDEKVYRDLEHEIALLDGRLQVAPPEASSKRVKVDPAQAYLDKFIAASAEEQQRMLAELNTRASIPWKPEVENEEID